MAVELRDRIAIETSKGEVVEGMYNPRLSYLGHTWATPWSNLQLAYFSGYVMWGYFNTPYQFTRPGFTMTEIGPWNENGEIWRCFQVNWPTDVHTHCKAQIFYVDADDLISRLDYDVEVAGMYHVLIIFQIIKRYPVLSWQRKE